MELILKLKVQNYIRENKDFIRQIADVMKVDTPAIRESIRTTQGRSIVKSKEAMAIIKEKFPKPVEILDEE